MDKNSQRSGDYDKIEFKDFGTQKDLAEKDFGTQRDLIEKTEKLMTAIEKMGKALDKLEKRMK